MSVILKNNVEHRKSFVRAEAMPAVVDPLIYESLTTEERLLTNWAAEGKHMTVKDAQNVLGDGVDWRKAKSVLDSLTTKYVLERKPGKDQNRHRTWSLRKKRGRTPHASWG